MTLPISIRYLNSNDLPLVFTDFIKGYSHNPQVSLCNKDIYLDYMREHIDFLISNSNTLIAHHIDDPTAIFGWLLGRVINNLTIIHWAHTKTPFHRMGVQNKLLSYLSPKHKSICLTHYFIGNVKKPKLYPSIQTILQKNKNMIYVPYEYNTDLFTAKII